MFQESVCESGMVKASVSLVDVGNLTAKGHGTHKIV